MVAARLTDRQKKKIVADYIQLGSYNATAKVNGVALNTVKKIVQGNAEIAEKCNKKKEQNTADVLKHMDEKTTEVCDIIDKILNLLEDEEKLKKSSAQALATTLGIVIDKFVGTPLEVEKAKAQIANLRGEDAHYQQQEDDPITKSLKEHFKEV